MKDFLKFFVLIIVLFFGLFFLISQHLTRNASQNFKHRANHPKEVAKDPSSLWMKANASYYDPLDSNQTKKNPDGIGSFNRKICSGSIALGSAIAKTYKDKGLIVFIEVDMDSIDFITPYGKNIFRVDDVMAKRYRVEGKYYLDFFHKDLCEDYKKMGRFDVRFRIIKIEKKQLS
ncbi:MAG TPA: hypothetical protein VK153_00265 [Candidatus Paceibacterota bacterium]|nr:hypothetical protein [Candidatus Paceibacterota bacterium]